MVKGTSKMEKGTRLHLREGCWHEGGLCREWWLGTRPWSLTNGEGHKGITLLKLPLLIQEVLGVEIFGVREELGVFQHRAQDRKHFSALVGRREGDLTRWRGDGYAESASGGRGRLGALGEEKREAGELGLSQGGALGDMTFMFLRQEVWGTWGLCLLRQVWEM